MTSSEADITTHFEALTAFVQQRHLWAPSPFFHHRLSLQLNQAIILLLQRQHPMGKRFQHPVKRRGFFPPLLADGRDLRLYRAINKQHHGLLCFVQFAKPVTFGGNRFRLQGNERLVLKQIAPAPAVEPLRVAEAFFAGHG